MHKYRASREAREKAKSLHPMNRVGECFFCGRDSTNWQWLNMHEPECAKYYWWLYNGEGSQLDLFEQVS